MVIFPAVCFIKLFFFCSDLCLAFGQSMLPLVDNDTINDLLAKGRRSKVAKTKTLATWASKEIRKLKNAASW